MEKEKSIKKRLIQSVLILVFALLALGSSDMSEQDAYDIGYGAGTLLRNATK